MAERHPSGDYSFKKNWIYTQSLHNLRMQTNRVKLFWQNDFLEEDSLRYFAIYSNVKIQPPFVAHYPGDHDLNKLILKSTLTEDVSTQVLSF